MTSRPPIQSGTSRACRRATEVVKSRTEERGTAEGRVRREIMVGGRSDLSRTSRSSREGRPGHTCFSSVDAQTSDSGQQESQVGPHCGRKRCTRGVRALGVEQGTVISTSESYERRCWQRLKTKALGDGRLKRNMVTQDESKVERSGSRERSAESTEGVAKMGIAERVR